MDYTAERTSKYCCFFTVDPDWMGGSPESRSLSDDESQNFRYTIYAGVNGLQAVDPFMGHRKHRGDGEKMSYSGSKLERSSDRSDLGDSHAPNE